ncbi:serpin family protein [Paenibacillus eucommiae]|uniref:Serpin B n=1 Tax=Paenibacillus eucommiae TaxID=1355755 RepID=A0ABS4J1L3_9BACL|nr:serpin family protein [Paenibacillus eucommiae]MBP1993220.1 serpin B [Paenibacillus eucommiae]
MGKTGGISWFIMMLGLSVLLLATGCGSMKAKLNEKEGEVSPITNNDAAVELSKFTVKDFDSRISEAHLAFAFDLYREIQKTQADPDAKNDFLSPVSIATALAMTANGASGATLEAMEKVLHLQGIDAKERNHGYEVMLDLLTHSGKEIRLAIANSLWAKEDLSFNKDFKQLNKDYYRAEINSLNLQAPEAADQINNWVRKHTEGKIDKIIEKPIDRDAILFLLNAIYFNANWAVPFNETATEAKTFTGPDQSKSEVQMMFSKSKYDYLENEGSGESAGFQAVRIPYVGNDLSMLVFLPDKETTLEEFLKQLTPDNWNTWLGSMKPAMGELRLPRFQMEYELTLNDTLKALGMERAFDRQQADFSAMISLSDNVFIQEVKHKSYIDVQEKGTEAAAVTSIEAKAASAEPPAASFEMEVNRPFFFAIHDKRTSSILFMGSVRQAGE